MRDGAVMMDIVDDLRKAPHEEDFGLPPITDAIKIAQDALEEE